jgi:hypothetical protein
LFDAFSSREPVSTSLENALLAAVLTAGRDAILTLNGRLKIRKQPQPGADDANDRKQNDDR